MRPRDACRSFQDVTLIIREDVEEHLAILPAVQSHCGGRAQASANCNKNASSFSWKRPSSTTQVICKYALALWSKEFRNVYSVKALCAPIKKWDPAVCWLCATDTSPHFTGFCQVGDEVEVRYGV